MKRQELPGELYEVARWGNGYFSINANGHVEVHPTKDPQRAIDLKELVDRPRPLLGQLVAGNGASFPSGHVMAAVAVWLWRRPEP